MPDKLSVNPWLEIWVKPRETIRAIVQYNPKYLFWLLSWIYGFPALLQFAQNASLGESLSLLPILLGTFIVAPFIGMLGITIISGLLYWTGQWIGGKASYNYVRAAVTWSNVPNLVNVAIWIVLATTFGGGLFMRSFGESSFLGYQQVVVFFAFLIQVIVAVWGFIIGLKTLGEVQGFSAWKALLNVLIPFFMVVIGLWILTSIGYMIFGTPH
jgi:hypothetical protein